MKGWRFINGWKMTRELRCLTVLNFWIGECGAGMMVFNFGFEYFYFPSQAGNVTVPEEEIKRIFG